MVVHFKHSLNAAVNHWQITTSCIEQLHLPTMVTATAISHIKCRLILTTINTDLKKANTQGMWEPEFLKNVFGILYLRIWAPNDYLI